MSKIDKIIGTLEEFKENTTKRLDRIDRKDDVMLELQNKIHNKVIKNCVSIKWLTYSVRGLYLLIMSVLGWFISK